MFVIDLLRYISPITAVQFSRSVMPDSLRPHGLQHARLPCPSPTPGACSNSCPLSHDTIQSCHPLSSPSPLTFNLSQHQGLFKWVSSSHQVAKVVHPFNGYNSMAFKHIHRVTISSLQSDLQHFHHPQKKLYPSAITLQSLSPLLLAMTFCLYRFTYSGDFI